jgi:dienelactone hydrolase
VLTAGTNQAWISGSDEWLIEVGMASRAGIETAELTRAGAHAAPDAFEGARDALALSEQTLRGPATGPIFVEGAQPGDGLPAVVLVHGSGPQDMDESVGANKPFRDIAWALAENGVASVRYDKRTFSYGGTIIDMYGNSLTVKEEVIDDAILAKELLASDSRIDGGTIVVVGHSLGGLLAPRIMDEGDFAGAVILAGSPRSLVDIIIDQIDYVMSIGDYSDEEKELQRMVNETQYDAYLSLGEETEEDIKEMLIFQINGYYLNEMEQYKTSDYFETFDEMGKPILILQGEKDIQVSYANDFGEYQKLAQGHSNIELKSYEGLNHLFMKSTMENPDTSEYFARGTVDQQVTGDIVKWINDNF